MNPPSPEMKPPILTALLLFSALAAAEDTAGKKENWWAFQPLAHPAVPALPSAPQPANPLDAFIRAKLAENGLAPAPEADPRTLIRRLTFDLTGLPPTPEEVEHFCQSALGSPPSSIAHLPSAIASLVDSLLARPQYGERWARHWMDAAHFAETHGNDQDRIRENAWPYRDYLIAAFNTDKPYARFVEEQVAGDVLFPDDPQATVALGFLAAGPWDESSLRDIREDTRDRQIARYLDRDDMLTTVMATFTSTTVHCARCHDHKFDPIPQRDYYALQAVFAGVDRANRAYDADPQIHARRQHLLRLKSAAERGDRTILLAAETQHEVADLERTDGARLAGVPPEIATILASTERTDDQRAVLAAFLLKEKIARDLAALPAPSLVYAAASEFEPDGALKPSGGPRPIFRLNRGEINQPREAAEPGALSCLAALPARFASTADEGARRAALAHWLTAPENALTWRSIVNRVWHLHFGRGLVATPNDFGHMGAAPSHPELLDWLAVWFRDEAHGSLKALHRLIVTSATYRQSTAKNGDADADNIFLAHMNRTRLDAESIRDTVLAISGQLDLRAGGQSDRQFDLQPGIHVTQRVDYAKFDVNSAAGRRRSVYRFLFRTLPDPFMDALDCPAGDQLAPARNASVTVQQALALWNSAFLTRHAQLFAERVQKSAPDLDAQIKIACKLALGRAPTPAEQTEFATYAQQHGLANLCRVILNSNEFVFLN